MVIQWVAAVVALQLVAAVARGGETPKTTLTVFAAASLTEAFQALAGEFERATPSVTVQFNFAGSPTLVQRIRQGASADVFAAADRPNMDALVQAGAVDGAPQPRAAAAFVDSVVTPPAQAILRRFGFAA
jgi:molybdate transport system substrate-binding protein